MVEIRRLRIVNVKTKLVRKFKYLRTILTEDRRRNIWYGNKKANWNGKKGTEKKLETKKRFLFKGFVISGLRYDSKGWTISLMINRRLETWFSRKQLRITWAEHVSNEKVLKEWEKKVTYIYVSKWDRKIAWKIWDLQE